MKITNVETISFMAKSRAYPTRWGYGTTGDERNNDGNRYDWKAHRRLNIAWIITPFSTGK